jgi:hypothetical protein
VLDAAAYQLAATRTRPGYRKSRRTQFEQFQHRLQNERLRQQRLENAQGITINGPFAVHFRTFIVQIRHNIETDRHGADSDIKINRVCVCASQISRIRYQIRPDNLRFSRVLSEWQEQKATAQ